MRGSFPLVDRVGSAWASVAPSCRRAKFASVVRNPPHRSKRRRAHPLATHIYRVASTRPPQLQETACDHPQAARPGRRSFYSLSFSVRLSLADAVALRLMRAPPCRAASWPRSGRWPRRRSWLMSRTKRSTWSARGAAGARRPPPPRRDLRPAIPSPRSSTTVSQPPPSRWTVPPPLPEQSPQPFKVFDVWPLHFS